MKKSIIFTVLLLAITACTTPPAQTNGNTGTTTTVSVNEADVDQILELDNFTITPAEFSANAGTEIKILVRAKSEGHTFNIDAYDVHTKTLASGDQLVVTVNIPAGDAGKSIEYYCDTSNHRVLGMTGTIKIK